ncbi:hypothetical protein like AT1G58215 [Hibiscus trionum]|uniref:NAB domain-containing protein n=1 Tax=Hibiscus trionum TaxID=183268 RepID=A0A9W7HI34_HIBTR|nr:hypothetical protein like AT1G58215 [Hibiscus trionum]
MALQKAASHAYSWWWVSHLRTKQSKWLEQNIQEMEEKVCSMLEIVDDDGDSFAKRAEIYFQKRPELVSFLEECFRAYQALAQRYDHLSKDLQSANKTIATVFPEQIPYSIDDEKDDESPIPCKSGVGAKVRFLYKDFRSQGQVNKDFGSGKIDVVPSSGLNKDEALGEIDKLKMEISEMQTERAFFYKKFRELDNLITEKQRKVCNLQVEFGVGSAIDVNETRTLVETRDLESCQESKRIKHLTQKFEALRNKLRSPQRNLQREHVQTKKVDNKVEEKEKDDSSVDNKVQGKEKHDLNVDNKVEEKEKHDSKVDNKVEEKEKYDSEVSRNVIEEKLDVNSNASNTMSQLVEKIDELVQRVVSWEASFSEKAEEKRLKSNKDEFGEHSMSLKEDKEAEIEGPGFMNSRMNMLEGELSRFKDLLGAAVDEIDSLRTHSIESSRKVDNFPVKVEADDKSGRSSLRNKDVSAEGKNNVGFNKSNDFNIDSCKDLVSMEEDKAKKKYLSDTASSIPYTEIEELETDIEEEQPNWRQLYLDGLDDREKNVTGEYSSVLENYKEVSKKLNEVDQKNRDGFSELAMQIMELKNALAARDGEIQTLHQKMGFLDENKYENSIDEVQSLSRASTLTGSIPASPLGQGKVGTIGKEVELEKTTHGRFKESYEKMGAGNNKPVNRSTCASAVENKIRSGMDELLEENLEFWLRFSAAFNQIKKYQASVKDLKTELSRLREKSSKQETSEHLKSEMRLVYCQFKEIRSGLTFWLENNGMLKDEVEGRYSSLCNIEDEIAAGLNGGELSGYQAGKFQGEVVNMKQEINKVCNELNAGFERARQQKHEVEKLMNSLEREIASLISSMSQASKSRRRTGSIIPLGSFLFGNKSKKSRGTSIG